MRLLLDTHIWLWSLLEPEKLSERVSSELESTENELWLSPVSIWELLILVEKGRVILDRSPAAWIAEVQGAVPIQEAPLTGEIAVLSRSIDLASPGSGRSFHRGDGGHLWADPCHLGRQDSRLENGFSPSKPLAWGASVLLHRPRG